MQRGPEPGAARCATAFPGARHLACSSPAGGLIAWVLLPLGHIRPEKCVFAISYEYYCTNLVSVSCATFDFPRRGQQGDSTVKRSYSKPEVVKSKAKLQSVAAQYISLPLIPQGPDSPE